MTLPELLIHTVQQQGLFPAGARLILAVSGGLDSVALADSCHRAGYSFCIAHANFQLRGEESMRDEAFVQDLGKTYHADVLVKRFDTASYAAEHKLSVQEAARELRYAWFAELVASGKGAYLLMAHHADDNLETLLMHFFRGTGLRGLTGMPQVSGYIRRPFLDIPRYVLEAHVKEYALSWVEDSSNAEDKYTRNYFRHRIIPAIEEKYPNVRENLQQHILRFRDTEALYCMATGTMLQKMVKPRGTGWQVPVKQLLQYRNRSLVYAWISPYGFTEGQVDEVIKLTDAPSGKYILSPDGRYRLLRHRHWFILSPPEQHPDHLVLIREGDKEINFPGGKLQLRVTDQKDIPSSR